MYKVPIMQKQDCVISKMDLSLCGGCNISASGGTGGTPSYTAQSLDGYKQEAKSVADNIFKRCG